MAADAKAKEHIVMFLNASQWRAQVCSELMITFKKIINVQIRIKSQL